MSAKPKITQRNVRVEGRKLRSLEVRFPHPERTIVVMDFKYNLNADSQETFLNLCYQACRFAKTKNDYIYVESNGLDEAGLIRLARHYRADAVVFADDAPAKRLHDDATKRLGLLRDHPKGFQTILTTPFYKWSHVEGFVKGESGKNLLGFNLKHLLAATRGCNPFRAVEPEELEFPIRMVNTREKFDRFLAMLEKRPLVCVDVEGRSLAKVTNTLYTIQFGWESKVADRYETYIIPWHHRDHVWSDSDLEYIRKRLRRYFDRTQNTIVFHFAKFDITQLMVALGIPVFLPKVYDSVAGLFALDENHKFVQKFYGLSGVYSLEIAEGMFNITRPSGLIPKDQRNNMARFSLDEMARYGAYDVVTPLILLKRYEEWCTDRTVGYANVEDYRDVVIHQMGVMWKTLALLERNGVKINVANAKKLVKPDSVFSVEAAKIMHEINATPAGQKANRILGQRQGLHGGSMFSSQNVNVLTLSKPSHKQTLFFEVLKLEPVNEGKNGDPSTDKAFQKRHKDVDEVKLFSRYNKVKTLKQNFADSILRLTDHDDDFQSDGRLRADYGFISVLTGRLSCVKPNLQNIPVRSDEEYELSKELVKSIKRNFTVGEGRVMLGSDFSAHEIRVAGVIAEDKMVAKVFIQANEAIRRFRLAGIDVIQKAIEVLAREGDIHIANVKFFFNKDVDKSDRLRYNIKAIVFGTIYGKMARGLAKELNIPVEEAQNLIDVLFERWSGVKTWIDTTFATGAKQFQIHYPNKRIRHLWGYLDEDIWTHRAMDRRGINSPIQGFASDIGVISIYESARWKHENITRHGYHLDLINTNVVHDAQYSDVLYEHMPMALYLTEHAMSTLPMDYYKREFGYEISIPLSYGMEFGRDWASLNEWNFRTVGYETTKKDKKTGEMKPAYEPGLYDMLRDLGKEMDRPFDPVIEDAKRVMKIRHAELRDDPYRMKVNGNNISRLFDELNLFRNQKKDT